MGWTWGCTKMGAPTAYQAKVMIMMIFVIHLDQFAGVLNFGTELISCGEP